MKYISIFLYGAKGTLSTKVKENLTFMCVLMSYGKTNIIHDILLNMIHLKDFNLVHKKGV